MNGKNSSAERSLYCRYEQQRDRSRAQEGDGAEQAEEQP